jgi:hypothetical protein
MGLSLGVMGSMGGMGMGMGMGMGRGGSSDRSLAQGQPLVMRLHELENAGTLETSVDEDGLPTAGDGHNDGHNNKHVDADLDYLARSLQRHGGRTGSQETLQLDESLGGDGETSGRYDEDGLPMATPSPKPADPGGGSSASLLRSPLVGRPSTKTLGQEAVLESSTDVEKAAASVGPEPTGPQLSPVTSADDSTDATSADGSTDATSADGSTDAGDATKVKVKVKVKPDVKPKPAKPKPKPKSKPGLAKLPSEPTTPVPPTASAAAPTPTPPAPSPAAAEAAVSAPVVSSEKPAAKKEPRRRKLVRGANAMVVKVLPEFTDAMAALAELDAYLEKGE